MIGALGIANLYPVFKDYWRGGFMYRANLVYLIFLLNIYNFPHAAKIFCTPYAAKEEWPYFAWQG